VGYSLSYLLLEDYPMAMKVMAEYRKTQNVGQTKPDYEFSEMILYEVQLMMEAGRGEDALKHISQFEPHICDFLTIWETKAEVYMNSGRLSEAGILYRDLIHRNPGNYNYYENLEKCLKLDSEEDRLQHYSALQEEFPRSHVARRIPLSFTRGEGFVRLLDKYLRRSLHKGVPSLFMTIRGLYSDSTKKKAIGDMVNGYVQSLKSCRQFHPDDTGPPEPPSTLLWTIFLLAQHYDRVGDPIQAAKFISEAIEHTPTDVQLYMLKARIYKHAGDYTEAARWIEEARTLDTADRYVNCKCVKYLLRINQVDKAV